MNSPTPTTPRFNPNAPRGTRRSQVCSVNSGTISQPLRLDGYARKPTEFYQNTMMDSGKHRDLPTLQIEEGQYFTRLTKKFLGREKWERPDPREVHSFIPGMVVRIVAQEGEPLPAGAPILTFEAMKMENTLTMPYDGVVRKILVKVGEVFAKDVILAEIEAP